MWGRLFDLWVKGKNEIFRMKIFEVVGINILKLISHLIPNKVKSNLLVRTIYRFSIWV